MLDLFGTKSQEIEKDIPREKVTKKYKEIDFDIQVDNVFSLKDKIFSHEDLLEKLLQRFKKNTLNSSIIFSGNYGIGKATLCYNLAARIILSLSKDSQVEIDFLQYNSHPDIYILRGKDGKISVDDMRRCSEFLSLKPSYNCKFIIIDDINMMNHNAMNALLKNLEEPPKNTFFFIINHRLAPVLPTILSRCEKINCQDLDKKSFIEILSGLIDNEESCEFYYSSSCGSPSSAVILHNLNAKKYYDKIYDLVKSENMLEILLLFENINQDLIKNKVSNYLKHHIIDLFFSAFLRLITKLVGNKVEKNYNNIISSIARNISNSRKYDIPLILS
jgi:DNA polymerase III delta prime subunit